MHSYQAYFNPRGCISLDCYDLSGQRSGSYFNPRGCISLDWFSHRHRNPGIIFQSTRLYKPRHRGQVAILEWLKFQSTRLYKPRLYPELLWLQSGKFQSTRLYKPRHAPKENIKFEKNFNPRGCISLDFFSFLQHIQILYFNPRGCISLDFRRNPYTAIIGISIHEAV